MEPGNISIVFVERYLVFYRQELYRRFATMFRTVFLYSGEQLGNLPNIAGIPKREVKCFATTIRRRRKIVWMAIIRHLFEAKPDIVVTEISISLLSTWVLFFLRPLLGFRIVFWGHGLEDYWRTRPGISLGDRIRLLWFRWSDGVIVYGKFGLNDLRSLLPKHLNLVRSPNALNSDAQNQQFELLNREGRNAVRGDVGIRSYAFCYIGRLAEDKGLERLPQFAAALHARGVIFEFHFIGSGPAEAFLRSAFDNLGISTTFHGTITEEGTKARLLYAFDCLLGPGPMGLAIVDAIGMGCPVLALSDALFSQKHGPEIEYVIDDCSGWVCSDELSWIRKAEELCREGSGCTKLRAGARTVFASQCQISQQMEPAIVAFERSLS